MRFTPSLIASTAVVTLIGGFLAVQMSGRLQAQEPSTINTSDKAAIEQIVHDYLLEHPEVIFESVDRYAAQQDAASLALSENEIRDNFATFMSGSAGFALGASAEQAEVLVVEFSDYHCGVCKRATDFVFTLSEKDPSLRLVLQELPVIHEKSREIAMIALAAPSPKAYAALHRELMASTGIITPAQVPGIARRAGVPYADFRLRLADEAIKATIEAKLEASMDIARAIGVDGTPGFVVASPNGSFVRFIGGYDERAVLDAIEEAKKG